MVWISKAISRIVKVNFWRQQASLYKHTANLEGHNRKKMVSLCLSSLLVLGVGLVGAQYDDYIPGMYGK